MTNVDKNEIDKVINKGMEILVNNGWMENEEFTNLCNKEISIDKNTKITIRECIKECTSPAREHIFNAFTVGKPEKVKVLILGQDPYPEPNRAHGYAFSFGNDEKPAKDSLLNIFKALQAYKAETTLGKIADSDIENWNTNLTTWANNNGVLLLNTVLTYKYRGKKEHQEAWKQFIECIIKKLLNSGNNKLVVHLWGEDARIIVHNFIFNNETITRDLLVLATSHPSENYQSFKRGFYCEAPNHFKACDEFLNINIWKNLGGN